MVVKDIVVKWLKDNGYDGLASEDCGCSFEDLAECQGYVGGFAYCKPAIRIKCSECNHTRNYCEYRIIYDATECFRAMEREIEKEVQE